MYKIVAAVNSMIENSHLIKAVTRSDNGEYFFLYDSRFKWSIIENETGSFTLFYYPGDQTIESLSKLRFEDWGKLKEFIMYTSDELKTKEAIESFSELYKTVQAKIYDMDGVLDQIIKTAA